MVSFAPTPEMDYMYNAKGKCSWDNNGTGF